jgi:hypothetical protein
LFDGIGIPSAQMAFDISKTVVKLRSPPSIDLCQISYAKEVKIEEVWRVSENGKVGEVCDT